MNAQKNLSHSEIKQHLNNLLKNLPMLPGVYQMYDKQGELLYVGKAKSLKNRVTSYFAKTIDHPKTRALVARIADFQTIITRNETEALLLEQNLIRQHLPPYNVLLKDDKSYLYVFLSIEDKPKLSLIRAKDRAKKAKGHFFGPFPEGRAARETLELMHNLFQICNCKVNPHKDKNRPCCLHQQIRLHKANGIGKQTSEEYLREVEDTMAFLTGKPSTIQANIIVQMEQAADNLDFEVAAYYRDKLQMLTKIQASQAVHKNTGEADVFAIDCEAGMVIVNVLTIRGGRVLGGKNFFPDLDSSNSFAENLASFIGTFYFQIVDDLPKEIICNIPITDSAALIEALHKQYSKKVAIKHNVKEIRASWQDMAVLNAKNGLSTKLATHRELHARFSELHSTLNRKVDRIECFDISHTMGEATIASCVVFDSEGKRKRDYRQYAIHGITGGDDYAAMQQALTRRYSKQPLPDLLLIDGGKGQLSSAFEVMQNLELDKQVFMVGVAKGEGRKAGLETLHFINGDSVNLANDNKALHLIQQVRDEAHRFAITKHRAKRDKKRSTSVLEVIPGLGEKRRRDLLNHFGGIQALMSASQVDIERVPGIGKVLAKTIYGSLHGS